MTKTRIAKIRNHRQRSRKLLVAHHPDHEKEKKVIPAINRPASRSGPARVK